jgi:hypothetical protein
MHQYAGPISASQTFAACSAAEDEHFNAFRLGHLQLHRDGFSVASGRERERAKVKAYPLSKAPPAPNAPDGVITSR